MRLLRWLWSALDVLLRCAFFAAAPLLLFVVVNFAPVTAIIINVAITFFILFFAEFLRSKLQKGSLILRVLRKHFALVEYYRTRSPRPFPYYLLYPLMLPYVLFSADARRELKLFRRYVVANLVLFIVLKYVEYRTIWAPDIGVKPFLVASLGVFVIQVLFVFWVIMPSVVTVVDCRVHKQTGRLISYGIVFTLSAALFGAVWIKRSNRATPEVCSRMVARSKAQPERARSAHSAAIDAASDRVTEGTREKRRVGQELFGAPLDAARDKLRSLYREDEAECFRLFALADEASGEETLLLKSDARKKVTPLWIGKRIGRATNRMIDDATELPGGVSVLDQVTAK